MERCGERLTARRADIEALVGAGMFAGHPAIFVARMFFTRVGVDGWARLPLDEQCTLPLKDRRVVGWLIVTGPGPAQPGLPGRLPSLPRRGCRAPLPRVP
jgi:hypothetical protein